MLTVLLGADWIANREAMLTMVSADVTAKKQGRVLIVPELISHEMERRLCTAAGDTASRYAEVLSFSRLYRRVSEVLDIPVEECLDNGGRVVAMAAAARQLHSRLKAYASVETRPEFLTGLIEAVDEFKRCCISADDLMTVSKQAEGALAQKLEELSLLLHAYDGLCQRGKRDPSDQMTLLLDELEGSSYAEEHAFYIDGFPDFTRQHMAILEYLICHSKNVVITFNCDALDSKNPAFEKAGETAGYIVRFAKKNDIKFEVRTLPGRNDNLNAVRNLLFSGKIERNEQIQQYLHLQQFKNVHEEVLAAAEQIQNYLLNGNRYREIGIVCSDINQYKNALRMIFDRCKIPLYQSGTESILEKPVIVTVLAALEAALNGFEQRDVIRYAKSMLSPLDIDVSDLLENYAIMWNIQGSRWFGEWTNHPDGLDALQTEKSENTLALLNEARRQLIDPLQKLAKDFANAIRVSDQVHGLYRFFENIDLSNRLAALADDFTRSGDYRNAQIMNQLWEILLTAMEQMYDVLGDTTWDTQTFVRLFRLLLTQYDVGTIPPVLDSVMVGPVSAMRCQQVKHLIVLGALEGQLPGYGGSTGILTDQERIWIRQLGVPLTGGAMDGVRAEFSEIYGVFCGAEETISIFCPAGQPSYLFRRMRELKGALTDIDISLTVAKADAVEAGAYLSSLGGKQEAIGLNILDEYKGAQYSKHHVLGDLSFEQVEGLYGRNLYLSASQIDKLADCRFSYFLKYGLRAKERKTITVDPAEFGTYVHAVLERTAREVMEHGGFHAVTLDEVLSISDRHSLQYMQERFSQMDSSRIAYLFQRNAAELRMVVQELWEELCVSDFEPIAFELAFGDEAELDAISIPGTKMQARLRGFVDRVDTWDGNGRRFYRVVDYKTGRKDFDYCDVYNGYGLQMLLYLFALEDCGSSLLGDQMSAAGVQYFPARIPVISAEGLLTEEESKAVRGKTLKRKGLLLNDEDVLAAMEPGDKPLRLNYSRRKDGSISGDLASKEQMCLLKSYVYYLLRKIVDDIASGCVDPNPYTRGSSHNACMFCPYSAVCHSETVEGRRNFKTMSAQRFWEEMEKEMKAHG